MLDRYQLGDQLGVGGMGVVYAGTDSEGRRVAIKLLREDRREATTMRRFRDEAVAGRIVEHPNLVRVLDDGELDGQPYLVMNLVEGELLGKLLRTRGVLALRRAIAIATQVLDALSALHDAGFAHGDVKSDNILVREDDSITLIDLGLAHVDGMPVTANRATVSGTPDYMAPELAWGDPPTACSDLYAVGCLLYELVTGSTPFAGGHAQDILRRQLKDPVVPPQLRCPDRTIPPALERVILHALTKSPQLRFSTARSFASALAIAARSFEDEPEVPHALGSTEAPTLPHLHSCAGRSPQRSSIR
jgi:eukaryotic-like serine/threonine-protein kinase